MIDWTVNVGNILAIGACLVTVVGLFYGLRSDVAVLRVDINHLEDRQDSLNEAFTQLGSILTQVAVQDTRLSMLEQSIHELRHGEGFVRPRKHASTNQD